MVRATAQVIFVCLVVFAVQMVLLWTAGQAYAFGLFSLSVPLEIQSWTLATSVYAHYDAAHLLGNLALFALLGLAVERGTSAWRFHAFVLVTGAIANLSQAAFSEIVVGSNAHVLGLSGAVFALAGYVVTGNRLSGFLLDRFHVPRTVQFLVYAGLAVVVTLVTAEPGVAIVGHFVGLFLGLALGAANALRS